MIQIIPIKVKPIEKKELFARSDWLTRRWLAECYLLTSEQPKRGKMVFPFSSLSEEEISLINKQAVRKAKKLSI